MMSTSVSICIPTFRRPEQLRGLLHSLQTLTFEKVSEPEISVVVVDNDPALSARSVITEFLSKRFRLRYRAEARRGISFARNAALEASRTADFVAFLDDDEFAAPAWLDELLNVQAAYQAVIVAGPVLPWFEGTSRPSLIENGFFTRRRHATGSQMRSAGAGNVLISKEVLRALSPLWFDPTFNLTGGEDTHFFRRCGVLGFPITWADDAIAYERIAPSRLTAEFLVARARDGGNHWTRVDLELNHRPHELGIRFAKGVARLLQGSALAIAAPMLSPTQQLRGRLLRAEGFGNLQAFFGHRYESYRS